MQAFPAAIPASPFDGNSTSMLQQQQQALRQQRQLNRRSTSFSAGSGAANGRLHLAHHSRVPSESPAADDAPLIFARLARDPMSQEHHARRKSVAIDPTEHRTSTENAETSPTNRWSHSTTSSVTSNTRRNRSSSAAVLSSIASQAFSARPKHVASLDASPRKRRVSVSAQSSAGSSTHHSRRSSKADNAATSLTALPPLHTTPALTDPNDTESPSTAQTVPTPSFHASSHVASDYFPGDDAYHAHDMAKPQQMAMARSRPVQHSSTNDAHANAIPEALGTTRHVTRTTARGIEEKQADAADNGGANAKRSRTKDRGDKDKKAMLAKALQKANTAVLLDNAQNHEGALEAYSDACNLLTRVTERTTASEDKRKLDAIRETYSNRMEELRQLVQQQPVASIEKSLPARPPSEASSAFATSPIPPLEPEPNPTVQVRSALSPESAPRLSYRQNDRDSFFQRTMKAVEDSASFSFDSNTESATTASAIGSAEEDSDDRQRPGRTSVHLPPPSHSEYMPRPLSPKRPTPSAPQSQAHDSWQHDSEHGQDNNELSRLRSDGRDSTSWLDTIDESGASCSDSVHSLDDEQGMRRKHIRGLSGGTDPDFDAAFDAAVEAAYDEGLEPDLEAQRKRLTAMRHAHRESVQVPVREIVEATNGKLRSAVALDTAGEDEAEDERVAEESVHDFGPGFNFELEQTTSALPRQSDSSGYSRSTWQSSQQSDRATAATSLSTVAEDGLETRGLKPVGATMMNRGRSENAALLPPTAPPTAALPQLPGTGNERLSSVQGRRLSSLKQKQLTIETSSHPELWVRASPYQPDASTSVQDEGDGPSSEESKYIEVLRPASAEIYQEDVLQSSAEHSTVHDPSDKVDEHVIRYRPSYEEVRSDQVATRPTLFQKNKTFTNLREHAEHTLLLASPALDAPSMTPMSSTFTSFSAAKRYQDPLAHQRAQLPSLASTLLSGDGPLDGEGAYLFDTSLSTGATSLSMRSPSANPPPASLEPCSQSFLLRPFWLMRGLAQTLIHPRGGYLTNKLFVPREVWQTRGVKLKLVEDKVATCDLLTAALGRLAGVDTFDADAVMEELQNFEEVMERVQTVLAKKLGSDVGVQGVPGIFKDASASAFATNNSSSAAGADASDKAPKSNSGKGYLTSWRKLRNKSSGTPVSAGAHQGSAKAATAIGAEKEMHTMPSVPMTSFVPVERRGHRRDARSATFEGPNKEYMSSLARLCDGVQVLDQIARQVEDPGLKHSSPTHVGLELSIRHAAEFFGFYVCRFILADLGLLMDKFLKRGTEWVLG